MSMMLMNKSVREIARACGVSQATVHKDVVRVRDEWAERRALSYEQHVENELARLTEMEELYWNAAKSGDTDAFDRWLRLFQERAKIIGVYAPKQHKVLTQDVIDSEVEKLVKELQLLGVEEDELDGIIDS